MRAGVLKLLCAVCALCADVAAPYSALSKKFVRKWLAGYGFDPEQQVLRAYLSTLKPKPPKVLQGKHSSGLEDAQHNDILLKARRHPALRRVWPEASPSLSYCSGTRLSDCWHLVAGSDRLDRCSHCEADQQI